MQDPFLVVGIGEALFDCFLDGRRVLGGAPLNVAFQANQLLSERGGRGVIVSRVGNDEAGRMIMSEVGRWGTDSAIQLDVTHPTGTVLVKPHGNDVQYEIVRDVAWDFLEWSPQLQELARNCNAVSFGTLAQRSTGSRETILRFVDEANQAIRLFDVNLRQDYYSREVIESSCVRSTLVKCNADELPLIYRMFFTDDETSPELQAERLRSRFHLDAWILTRGKDGTHAMTRMGVMSAAPISFPVAPDADPVGAGDGCTAAILVGLLSHRGWEEVLAQANHVGAWIASQPGATPRLPIGIMKAANEVCTDKTKAP